MEKTVKSEPLTYGVYTKYIDTLAKRYSDLKVATCGKSFLGKEIYSLVLGDGNKNTLYVGGTHGLEWITSLLLLRFCEDLLFLKQTGGEMSGYGIAEILKNRRLVVIPELNPDGIEISLNGISACGEYKNENFKACGGDFGSWSANAHGVDINHNFNADWYSLRDFESKNGIDKPAPRRFGGFFPESEPETKAVTRLCRNVPFDMLFSFHSQGEEIYYEYGKNTPKKSYISATVLSAVSGYSLVKNEGHATSGGLKDWFIEEFKKPAFTVEVGKGKNPLPAECLEKIYSRLQTLLVLGLVL